MLCEPVLHHGGNRDADQNGDTADHHCDRRALKRRYRFHGSTITRSAGVGSSWRTNPRACIFVASGCGCDKPSIGFVPKPSVSTQTESPASVQCRRLICGDRQANSCMRVKASHRRSGRRRRGDRFASLVAATPSSSAGRPLCRRVFLLLTMARLNGPSAGGIVMLHCLPIKLGGDR
jgi:hypothetical protein